ncbi:MAG: DNA polymerase III subunit [Myxococcales bacterium]|nr:DNA polymerase III subunit [Myxococcales bacterium]
MLPVYRDILGHEAVIARLENARRGGRVAHAYLFSGPRGVGKERVAWAFAAALACPAPEPCGVCESCTRVARGTHPDVRLLASEEELATRGLREDEGHKDKEKKAPSDQIRVSDLDEAANLFRHRPSLGRAKVLVVVDAERMNLNTQNRFLKTLEEPTPDSVIILCTANPEALLPTVRSRCQSVSFGPVPQAAVAQLLSEKAGLAAEPAGALAALAQGSPGRGLELAESEELTARAATVEALRRVFQGDLEDALSFAEEQSAGGEGREQAQLVLDRIEAWLRDALLLSLGAKEAQLINPDLEAQAQAIADSAGHERLFSWIDSLQAARAAMQANANPRLTMESFLLSVREP